MPRGLPDYYNPDTLVSQRLANVEEIVTILQGIANLDNRGRTLYYTHFDEGVNGWYKAKSGDGVVPVATINEAEIEPASFKMDAGTDGGNGTTTTEKSFLVQEIKVAGLEFSLAHRANSAEVTIVFSYDNGTIRLYGQLVYDPNATTLYIMDNSTPVAVVDLPGAISPTDWLQIKLVVDFENQEYVRLLVGLDQIDISGYSLPTMPTVLPGILFARFETDAQGDTGDIAYVGHVAITIDEP